MSENTRPRDTRILYSNAFGVAFSAMDMQLDFGIQSNPGTDNPAMDLQTTIMMTHQSAKFLGLLIQALVENFETATGTVIPVDQSRLERVRELIGVGGRSDDKSSLKDVGKPPRSSRK